MWDTKIWLCFPPHNPKTHCLPFNDSTPFKSYYCSKWLQSDILQSMSPGWKYFSSQFGIQSHINVEWIQNKFTSKAFQILFHLNPCKLLLFRYSRVIKFPWLLIKTCLKTFSADTCFSPHEHQVTFSEWWYSGRCIHFGN